VVKIKLESIMFRKAAVIITALILVVATSFTAAMAFPFHWGLNEKPKSQVTGVSHQMAAPGSPEPNEEVEVPLPSWAPLVKCVMPTVVNVAVVETIRNVGFGPGGSQQPGDNGSNQGFGTPFGFGPGNPFNNNPLGNNPFAPFNFFFGQIPRQFKQRGLGSGVIVSRDGYIFTNYHVVEHADRIMVTLMDKRQFVARVIGTDPKTDLALIKIKATEPLPYAQLGDSNAVQVGDWVMAIGNPFGFNLTVTSGIVSAKGRALGGNYDDFIQTDASINPGNSGGPLFDTHGRVIGINSAIYSDTGSNAGIGFAIPIDLAKAVMQQLREHGHVIRGWLGVKVQELTPELAQSFGLSSTQGALVAEVEKDTPAANAGIRRGDVIVKFDGQVVHDEHELPEMVAQAPIGKTVPIEVMRNGKRLTLRSKIEQLRGGQLAAAGESQPSGERWGVSVQKLTPDIAQQLGVANDKGVVITEVTPDSPADDAGLQRGDVVLEVNHDKVTSPDDFANLVDRAEHERKPALLLVERGNGTMFTVVNRKG
jgi:serine protease Do